MSDAGPVEDYKVPPGSRDELLDDDARPKPHAAPLIAALRRMGPEALRQAGLRRDTIFMQQGITFEVAGTDGMRRDRPFPLDLVPRMLTAAEWTTIKRGLAQRIRALNAFVDDVYHAHEIVRAGVVPWSLIVSRPSFARPVHGVRAPGGVYCHVSGCDLVRDGDGSWRVLEDNVRTPSGISYVLENRQAMTRLMPELFETTRACTTPLRTLTLLAELIPDRFEYRQGATYVDSTVRDLLVGGAGVCQDFVHLGLCLLRHHGIAARYVSGYLFAAGSKSSGESVEVDTHAWLEALLPVPGGGEPVWVGADPTNRGLVAENHVKIGHGRHYADVPPIKGVYRGGADATLEASVTMTRLERADPASSARS